MFILLYLRWIDVIKDVHLNLVAGRFLLLGISILLYPKADFCYLRCPRYFIWKRIDVIRDVRVTLLKRIASVKDVYLTCPSQLANGLLRLKIDEFPDTHPCVTFPIVSARLHRSPTYQPSRAGECPCVPLSVD